jgi:hypothetical protein
MGCILNNCDKRVNKKSTLDVPQSGTLLSRYSREILHGKNLVNLNKNAIVTKKDVNKNYDNYQNN